MELKLGQYQKQLQRLIMTPQMQQSIKLLQLNSMEMEQLAEQLMLENPFLELADEQESSTQDIVNTSLNKYIAPDSTPSNTAEEPPTAEEEATESASPSLLNQPETFDKVDVNWDDVFDDSENKVYYQREDYEEHDFTEYTPLRTSLQDHLLRQIRLSTLEGRDVEIAEYIVGNLDEEGYLRLELSEIAHDFDVPIERVEDVLDIVQEFDPPGIAARNLKECLRLQLEDQNVRDSFLYRLIDDYLEDLQKRKFKEIAKATGEDEARVVKAFEQISRLEPKPGRSFTKEQPQYITPDVIVKKVDNKYIYYINEGRMSRLGINPYYRQLMLENNLGKDDKRYAKEQFRSALWLIKNIEKRKMTILRITEAIVNAQKDFFDKGMEYLKPLTLREVAEQVGMHESTVARVANGKYMETPRGLFELKWFFSSGIVKHDGETTSSTNVKDMIAKFIQEEQPENPHSDQKIARMLEKKGIKIARRTVAKYREMMKILPAKMRKSTTAA